VQIDATPFRNWYLQHYGIDLSGKDEKITKKQSAHVQCKIKNRANNRKIDDKVAAQIAKGKLYACISSRPGQCGRADGYILEGKELIFYLKQMDKKN
jgi:small subunit ribosomal protein S8e